MIDYIEKNWREIMIIILSINWIMDIVDKMIKN